MASTLRANWRREQKLFLHGSNDLRCKVKLENRAIYMLSVRLRFAEKAEMPGTNTF
jgi:hypothetical protein